MTNPLTYQEGYAAYEQGDSIDMNPYDDKDAQHIEWQNGWWSADYDHSDFDIGD